MDAPRGPLLRNLRTERLVLTPLGPSDAEEMVGVLADASLYVFTGGEPPNVDALSARYRAQVAGPAAPGERWLNWIVRIAATGDAIGYVQATVEGASSDIAWVIGLPWQGHGFAREAAAAMCAALREDGVGTITAHIHPDHARSARVAATIGLLPTDEIDEDGEQIWRSEA